MYTKNKLSNNFRVRTPDSEGNLSIPTPTKNSACEDDEINDWRLSPPSHDLHTKRTLPSHKVKQGTTEAMQETTEERKDAIPVRQKTKANDNIQENPGNDEAKLSLSGCGVNSDTDGAMPTPKDEDDIKKKNLRPDSQIINRLNSLNTAKVAELPTPPQQYGDKFRPLPLNASDNAALDADQQIIDHALKLIDAKKKPGCSFDVDVSVSLNISKVRLGEDRLHNGGRNFVVLEPPFKNGSIADRVCRVRDNKTGNIHVLKVIPLSKFREQEIRAMRTLKETNISPELYLFCLVDNTVQIHMELVNGVLLEDVIFKKIDVIHSSHPHLVTPFIKNLFYSLLSAVRRMHDHGWIHGDLHYQNILVGQDLTFSIIDFGEAKARKKEKKKDELYYLVKGLCIDIEEIMKSFKKSIQTELEKSIQTELEKSIQTELEELLNIFKRIQESKSSTDTQRILENLWKQKKGIDMEKIIPILFPPPTLPDKVKPVHDTYQIPGRSGSCTSDKGIPIAHPDAVQLSTSILPTLGQSTPARVLETKGRSPIAKTRAEWKALYEEKAKEVDLLKCKLAYSLEENQRLEAELQPEKSDPDCKFNCHKKCAQYVPKDCTGEMLQYDGATVLPKQRPLSLEIATKCGGSSMNSTPDGDIPSPPSPFLVQLSKSIQQDINH